jgi:hypothetical protein
MAHHGMGDTYIMRASDLHVLTHIPIPSRLLRLSTSFNLVLYDPWSQASRGFTSVASSTCGPVPCLGNALNRLAYSSTGITFYDSMLFAPLYVKEHRSLNATACIRRFGNVWANLRRRSCSAYNPEGTLEPRRLSP